MVKQPSTFIDISWCYFCFCCRNDSEFVCMYVGIETKVIMSHNRLL